MTHDIRADDGVSCMRFVPEKGGTAYSLVLPGTDGPRELLYVHDNFWQDDYDDLIGGWPFCFPVCARLQRNGQQGVYLYNGKRYQLPIHGVSWYQPWRVLAHEQDRLVMQLSANTHSLEHYPFQFEVTLDYRIAPGKLHCEQMYTNHGDEAMPYYAGFHPYFLTPAADSGKVDVILDFASSGRLLYNEQLTDIEGWAEALSWPCSVADSAINEQLSVVDGCNVFHLQYDGGDQVTMQVVADKPDLFPYIQTYTVAEKPFICVEPWMGHPNALNTAGACQWLQPGQSQQATMHLQLTS